MYVLPSIDLQKGRSRLVWWPGAATGSGTPTDRPATVAQAFVAQGAPAVHLVDLDGAGQGMPANLEAIGAIAKAVVKPLQLAGGVDGPDQIKIAFAAGATRVVMPLWAVVEDGAVLAECVDIAGDWLAVGMDARPASLRDYPWRHRPRLELDTLVDELQAAGVQRFVFSHVGDDGVELVGRLVQGLDAEVVVAGGVNSIDGLRQLRDAGVAGVILGEVLFTGAVDLSQAIEAVS